MNDQLFQRLCSRETLFRAWQHVKEKNTAGGIDQKTVEEYAVPIAKILEDYGTRCNFSVFECVLTKTQVKTMQEKLIKTADHKFDCILYYYLCKSCTGKSEIVGKRLNSRSEIVWV